MENEDIRRGVDFESRFGEQASTLDRAFHWWEGEKFSRKTILFLSIIFIINLIILFPVLGKDFAPSYASSFFFTSFAELIKHLFISERIFFSLLTIPALLLAPICFYLFVRRTANRHELTAFIATLLFVLPNPFYYSVPIMVHALINGDGAHMLMFATMPLFLLYVQGFITTGKPSLAFLSSVGMAVLAVISPFAIFNFLLLFIIVTIAEGFLGNLRVKIIRFVVLLITSFLLSIFWYYPTLLITIGKLEHVQFALSQFLSVAPLAIPMVPVLGALFFLIFDRREKLKPIFISANFFILYITLFNLSNSLNVRGIFTSERYLPELAFSSAFFLSILFVLLTELILRNFLPKMTLQKKKLLLVSLQIAGSALIIYFITRGVAIVSDYAKTSITTDRYSEGIGSLKRLFIYQDITALVSGIISLGTFCFLFYIFSKYLANKRKTALVKKKKASNTSVV